MSTKKETKEAYHQAAKNPLKADGKTAAKTSSASKKPAAKTQQKSAGRPKVTQEKLEKVIERMCEGESLVQICKDRDMPSRGTVLNYAYLKGNNADDDFAKRFAQAYREAAEIRSESWAEDILNISDSVDADKDQIAKARLRVDARKWLLSKINARYGDRQAHEISGPNGGPVETESKVTFYIPKNGREAQKQQIEDEQDE